MRLVATIWIPLFLLGCSIRSQPDLIQSESMVHKFLYDQWTVEKIEERYARIREEMRDLIWRLREVRKRNRELYRDLQGELEFEADMRRVQEEIGRLGKVAKGLEETKKKLTERVVVLRKEVARLRKEVGELGKEQSKGKPSGGGDG